MNITNGEPLGLQAHILNCIFSFINSASIKCAVELGIPDIIHKHGKPMSLSELNAVLPIHQAKACHIPRLMRVLTHFDFFTKQKICENQENEGYILTPISRLLLKDEPMSVIPYLQAVLDPILIKPWLHLSEWFQNDNLTAFDTAHGRTFWEYCGQEPRLNIMFNDALASDSCLMMSVVVKERRGVFEGLNSLVDVGGGTGSAAKAINDNFEKMKCIVFDLPHVVQDLRGRENLSYVGGDMFVEIPQADAVLLKLILHNWSDKESVTILKKCKEAIQSKEKGGKVIIIDINVEIEKDDKLTETQLFFDLEMMALVTGKERNEKEWAKLFYDAGFSEYKISPILGLRSLIEVYP